MMLQDNFTRQGTDLAEFAEALQEIVENTSLIEMQARSLKLLPVVDPLEYQQELLALFPQKFLDRKALKEISKKTVLILELQRHQLLSGKAPHIRTISLERMSERGSSEELFREVVKESRLLLKYEGKLFLTSPKLSGTLCARAQLKGMAAFDTSLERAAFLMARFYTKNVTFQALVRRVATDKGGIQKVMALFSQKYAYIPQTTLLTVIEQISADMQENPDCKRWEINHYISSVYLEFPKKAQALSEQYQLPNLLVPGLKLYTSDVGDASLSARPTWRIGGSLAIGKAVTVSHKAKQDVTNFFPQIQENVLVRYERFIQRLKAMQRIPVMDPTSALKNLFQKMRLTAIIGKKKTPHIIQQEIERLNREKVSSLYQLILHVLQMPGTYSEELAEDPATKLSQSVYDLVFHKDLIEEADNWSKKAG